MTVLPFSHIHVRVGRQVRGLPGCRRRRHLAWAGWLAAATAAWLGWLAGLPPPSPGQAGWHACRRRRGMSHIIKIHKNTVKIPRKLE